MNDSLKDLEKDSIAVSETVASVSRKGPLSFLSGALTSVLFAYICLIFSEKIVIYFSEHSISYSSPIAQSVASGFKTLIIGISFLATFTFGFIGLGLILVFVKSLFNASDKDLT